MAVQIFFLIVILLGAIIHEYSHGWMAFQCGDDTAKVMGRLTVNPLAHIDPFGTILLPLTLWLLSTASGQSFIFAYAKPVPVNYYNLRNQKWGPALVALAGPMSNLLTALVIGIIMRFIPFSIFYQYLAIIVFANILLAVFNLVPIPPLDGSHILDAILPDRVKFSYFYENLQKYGVILLFIFIFYFFSLIEPIINFIFYLIIGNRLTL